MITNWKSTSAAATISINCITIITVFTSIYSSISTVGTNQSLKLTSSITIITSFTIRSYTRSISIISIIITDFSPFRLNYIVTANSAIFFFVTFASGVPLIVSTWSNASPAGSVPTRFADEGSVTFPPTGGSIMT